jgi:hypothetical protein
LTDVTISFRTCEYCGGVCTRDDPNCRSCGSPLGRAVAVTHADTARSRAGLSVLSLAIWLLLGVFGGYVYWSGNKPKAYARAGLWLASIGWATLGLIADRSGNETLSIIFFLTFVATLLLILLLWIFDLAHLLRMSRET